MLYIYNPWIKKSTIHGIFSLLKPYAKINPMDFSFSGCPGSSQLGGCGHVQYLNARHAQG
jgi:hypothetical protein